MVKKKETPVHSIRFPNLENEINKFAQANSFLMRTLKINFDLNGLMN